MKTSPTSHSGHNINMSIKGVHAVDRVTPQGKMGLASRGEEQLPAFKGTRAGAKRAGDSHIPGYPNCSIEGNGHPGAHQT